MSKKLKICSLKVHKDAEISKNPKTFLNEGTNHKTKLYGRSKLKK